MKRFAAAAALLFAFTPVAHAELYLTFGGDMNFNSSRQKPLPHAAVKNGRQFSYESLFAGISPFLDGEFNFANIETVVSDRTDLPDSGGKFVFASHTNGMRAAVDQGLNLFSLANNHTGDHGLTGMKETIRNMESLSRELPIQHHGIGRNRAEALQPTLFDVKTESGVYRVALLSITGVSNSFTQAGPDRPGTLYLRDANDFADSMRAMANARADYKILSVHWGRETFVNLDAGQRALFHRALSEGGIDLILGHHPHVVRPVEKVGHKVIFYSLGNYLMLGAANINGNSAAQSYGLLGKLHLNWDPSLRRLVAQAAEAIPLYDMHFSPKPYDPLGGKARIDLLNQLSGRETGTNALTFRANERGFGQACLGANPGARAEKICRAGR
jgi:hypothetical protein